MPSTEPGAGQSTYRRRLPRLYELHDLLPNPSPPNAYFRDLDQSLATSRAKLAVYYEIEEDLQSLDPKAWTFLKSELAPLLTAHDRKRGWQQLVDKLNQTKAYRYLKRAGYEQIEFITPSIVRGRRTPDLIGYRASMKALCEVKTINISDDEAERRYAGGVGATEIDLTAGFFKKLRYDLTEAKAQLDAFCAANDVQKLIYLIPNFDDSLHEYADLYERQIQAYLERETPCSGVEIIFNIKRLF